MDLLEKKEIVYESYSEAFDKDMAYKKALLTEEETKILSDDKDFQQRLDYCLILEKEKIIKKLREFKDSYDPKISFSATKELGRILYPEFFEEKEKKPQEHNVHIHKNSKEENDRLEKEFGHVIEDKGCKFKKPTSTIFPPEKN